MVLISCLLLVCSLKIVSSCGSSQRLPIANHRICLVKNVSLVTHAPELYWEDRDDSLPEYETCDSGLERRAEGNSCIGHVGMHLKLECKLAGAYACKEEDCNNYTARNDSLIIESLQPEDAGEYVCRTASVVLFAYNVTVLTSKNDVVSLTT